MAGAMSAAESENPGLTLLCSIMDNHSPSLSIHCLSEPGDKCLPEACVDVQHLGSGSQTTLIPRGAMSEEALVWLCEHAGRRLGYKADSRTSHTWSQLVMATPVPWGALQGATAGLDG